MKEKIIKILPSFLLIVFFVAITIFYYWGINKVYFQQDEWFKTGKSIYYIYADFGKLWTNKFGFHYYPLLNLFFMGEYIVFKLNVSYYLYLGIILQAITATLFYVLSKRLFGNRFIPFILSVLFLINPGVHQVMLNEMVSLYKIALIQMLVVLIFLYDQISKGRELTTRAILVLSIFYAISTFFFEGSLILIVLAPAFYFLFKNKKTFIKLNKKNIFLLAGVILFTIARLMLQSKLPEDAPLPIEGSFALSIFYNAVTTSHKFLIEYLFNLKSILYFADIYSQKIFSLRHDPTVNLALVSITIGYELVVYYLTAFILFITTIIIILTHNNSKTYKRAIKILSFSVIWVIVNSVVIAPQGRIFTSIESRYLYISGVAILWFLGALLILVWNRYKDNIIVKSGVVFIVLLYISIWSIYSYYSIDKEKQAIIKVSEVRRNIINQFVTLYPKLPDTAVFYVYCSDDCTSNQLYGMPKEWVVPFQNGLGWTLLSVYSNDNPKRYAPFFSNYLFWDSKSAGYRKIGNTAFGFFTDEKALKQAMKENSLTASDIIVLSYESKKYKLTPMKNKEKILFPELY